MHMEDDRFSNMLNGVKSNDDDILLLEKDLLQSQSKMKKYYLRMLRLLARQIAHSTTLEHQLDQLHQATTRK